jgi:pre-rRNA-processing protein TSR4
LQESKIFETEEEFERKQLLEYEKLEREGKTGDIPASELEQYAEEEEDKTFAKFKKRVDANPDQVIQH